MSNPIAMGKQKDVRPSLCSDRMYIYALKTNVHTKDCTMPTYYTTFVTNVTKPCMIIHTLLVLILHHHVVVWLGTEIAMGSVANTYTNIKDH